jgi:hypothetical protein
MWALNEVSGFVKGCVIVGMLLIVIVGVQSAASLFHTGAVVGGQSVHIVFKEMPTFFGEVKGGKENDTKSAASGDAPTAKGEAPKKKEN